MNLSKKYSIMPTAQPKGRIVANPPADFAKRIESVRNALDLSRRGFADLLGVSEATINRLETLDNPPSRYFEDAVKLHLPAVYDYFFKDGEMPEQIPLQRLAPESSSDGARLREYLKRHGIRQNELAEMTGGSAPQVNNWIKSNNIRLDIKTRIAAALRVPVSIIFDESLQEFRQEDYREKVIGFKLVRPADRKKLTDTEAIETFLPQFSPIPRNEAYFMQAPADLTAREIRNSFILEIIATDDYLPAGSLVLVTLVRPNEYDFIDSGIVALPLMETMYIRRVVSNRLRESNVLDLTVVDDTTRLTTLSIGKDEIDFLLRIRAIVYQPL